MWNAFENAVSQSPYSVRNSATMLFDACLCARAAVRGAVGAWAVGVGVKIDAFMARSGERERGPGHVIVMRTHKEGAGVRMANGPERGNQI